MKDLKDDFLHIVNFITSVEKLIEKEDTVTFTKRDVELLETANEKLSRITYELFCRLEHSETYINERSNFTEKNYSTV